MKDYIPSDEETLAEIGILLILTQDVERTISELIGLVYPDGRPTWEQIEKLNAQTLGGLISKLRARVEIDPRFDSLLSEFRDRRNLFVHNLRHQPWFDLHSEEGRNQIWNSLALYSNALFQVHTTVTAALFKFGDSIGIKDTEFHAKLKETGFLQMITTHYPLAQIALKKRKI